MYIPTIVIICMICGGIGGTLGSYLAKKNKKQKNKEDDQAVDKCRNCMSQQPILMRKSAKNVII